MVGGLAFDSTFRASYGPQGEGRGRGQGTVSEDGRQMVWTFWDTVAGPYNLALQR